jgi:hypothetical protein
MDQIEKFFTTALSKSTLIALHLASIFGEEIKDQALADSDILREIDKDILDKTPRYVVDVFMIEYYNWYTINLKYREITQETKEYIEDIRSSLVDPLKEMISHIFLHNAAVDFGRARDLISILNKQKLEISKRHNFICLGELIAMKFNDMNINNAD